MIVFSSSNLGTGYKYINMMHVFSDTERKTFGNDLENENLNFFSVEHDEQDKMENEREREKGINWQGNIEHVVN